jgi:hypothetical protein
MRDLAQWAKRLLNDSTVTAQRLCVGFVRTSHLAAPGSSIWVSPRLPTDSLDSNTSAGIWTGPRRLASG